MKPAEQAKKAWREVADFLHWLSHSKAAISTALILALLLPAYVFYMGVFVPASTCNREFGTADTLLADIPDMDPDSVAMIMTTLGEIGNLELENAYLTGLLALARQDSAYVDLNLADSLLRLRIKGVTVRECKLSDIRVTRRLRCLRQSQLLHWVSEPFWGRTALSTIPKIRYIVKEAPKDTSEAALQSAKPILSDTSSVFFTLYFDRRLVVEVEQAEEPYDSEDEVISEYRKSRQQVARSQTLEAVLHGTSPEPEILIRITLAKADARAIYRGLPVQPGLALKLP